LPVTDVTSAVLLTMFCHFVELFSATARPMEELNGDNIKFPEQDGKDAMRIL